MLVLVLVLVLVLLVMLRLLRLLLLLLLLLLYGDGRCTQDVRGGGQMARATLPCGGGGGPCGV